jgi:hypothetical protein
MVHRWWFHKGLPHDREHHHFRSLIAWPHETSGHELPPIFVSKKRTCARISTKRKKTPAKKKIMRKNISRKKLSRKETGIA